MLTCPQSVTLGRDAVHGQGSLIVVTAVITAKGDA